MTTLKAAADTAQDVKDSVVEFGRSAGRKMEEARDHTSGALHQAASSVRQGSARIDVLAAGAASRLDATASFVKDADLKGISASLRRFGRNHLTEVLIAAVAVGYLAGSAFNRAKTIRIGG